MFLIVLSRKKAGTERIRNAGIKIRKLERI